MLITMTAKVLTDNNKKKTIIGTYRFIFTLIYLTYFLGTWKPCKYKIFIKYM